MRDQAAVATVAIPGVVAIGLMFVIAFQDEIRAVVRRWRRGGDVTETVGRRVSSP